MKSTPLSMLAPSAVGLPKISTLRCKAARAVRHRASTTIAVITVTVDLAAEVALGEEEQRGHSSRWINMRALEKKWPGREDFISYRLGGIGAYKSYRRAN
jgi:hypothetical protein